MELFRLLGTIALNDKEAIASINSVSGTANKASEKMSKAFKAVGVALAGAFSVQKLTQFSKACVEAYNIQSQAELKLQTIMKQRMQSTDNEIQQIKDLASAQQKLGVVGDELQLAGSQQLSTFLNSEKALQALIPAMNNLAVQQNGVNVTSENMVNIGNLMGKVMQGQTAALTRVGITFTEAQEEMLKYGNEEEKAAILAQVITDNVGNMNAEFAKTDAGKIQQAKNLFGDLQEMIGERLIGIVADAMEKVGKFSVFIMDNFDAISKVAKSVAAAIGGATTAMLVFKAGAKIQGIVNAFQKAKVSLALYTATMKGATIAQGVMNGALTMTEAIVALLTGKLTLAEFATILYAKAQAALNAVMSANPIGIVIVAITALVAAFVLLWKKSEGFRNFWINAWEKIKSTAIKVGKAIGNAITSPIENAMNKIKAIVNKIKGFFPLKIGKIFSNLKLPKINIDGGKAPFGIGGKGKLPSFDVKWNAVGAVFKKPTIFSTTQGLQGVGEAGAEAVAPIDTLQQYVAGAVASQNEGIIYALQNILSAIQSLDGNMGDSMRYALNGTAFELNRREFGRLVKEVR